METTSFISSTSVRLIGQAIPDALDRHGRLPGFDQRALSAASVDIVGAGGLTSHVAPMLVRKGIGSVTLIDPDIVEPSNLNRQFFYEKDLGKNKAMAMALNLYDECVRETVVTGHSLYFEEWAAQDLHAAAVVIVCGVDNNPTRTAVAAFARKHRLPAVFSAVSRDADHGYVFVQEAELGACWGCLSPDALSDERYPCPGIPAVADILQAVGALVVYAIDSLVMGRARAWNYRTVRLSDGSLEASTVVKRRLGCAICTSHA